MNTKQNFRSGFISIVGRPNVGKSTLLNALLGEKIAIISDKPQTTRNRILGIVNPSGAQLVFMDTPGIHKPMHKMNEFMVKTALATYSEVDVILMLVEATEQPGAGDRFIIETLKAVKNAGLSADQQDRPGRQGEAAAAHPGLQRAPSLCRDHSDLGAQERPPRPHRCDRGEAPGRPSIFSRGPADRTSRNGSWCPN